MIVAYFVTFLVVVALIVLAVGSLAANCGKVAEEFGEGAAEMMDGFEKGYEKGREVKGLGDGNRGR
jgi:hypothetical protein